MINEKPTPSPQTKYIYLNKSIKGINKLKPISKPITSPTNSGKKNG